MPAQGCRLIPGTWGANLDASLCRPLVAPGGPRFTTWRNYLLVKDTNAFAALPRQLFDAELYALNAEYAYLRSPSGYIVRLGDGEIQSVEHFKTETANRKLTRMDTAGRPVEAPRRRRMDQMGNTA